MLPIWIGMFEADAIAIPIQKVPVTRPLCHQLMLNLIHATGSTVRATRVDRLADETFFGSAVLETPRGERSVGMRASDAIALAQYAEVPILVATTVMDEAGLHLELDDSS
jgi:bifunctional DNase/RNase